MTTNLNATVNRSIGMAPRDVTFENVPVVSAKLYQDRAFKPCKFSEGNKVRIPREKNIFSKGYLQSKFYKLNQRINFFFQIGLTLFILYIECITRLECATIVYLILTRKKLTDLFMRAS